MRSENLQRLRRQVHMRQVASKPTRRAIEVGPATSMDPSSASRREHRSLKPDFDDTASERARGIPRPLRCHPPALTEDRAAGAQHRHDIGPPILAEREPRLERAVRRGPPRPDRARTPAAIELTLDHDQ